MVSSIQPLVCPKKRPKLDLTDTDMKKSPKEVFRPSTISTPLTVILTDKMGNEIKIIEIKEDPTMLLSEHKEQNRKQHILPDVTEMEVDDISVQDDSAVNNKMKVDDVSVQDDSAVDNASSHILYEYSSNNETLIMKQIIAVNL